MKPENIAEEYERLRPTYEEFTARTADLVGELLAEARIPVHGIETRTKDIAALRKKLARTDASYGGLTDLPDLSGIRVIVYRLKDVAAVCSVLESRFSINRAQTEDKQRNLEANEFGYRSVHYGISLRPEFAEQPEWQRYSALEAEIQIRTVLQHAWAVISHGILYKGDEALSDRRQRRLFRVASLLELSDEELSALSEEGTLPVEPQVRDTTGRS